MRSFATALLLLVVIFGGCASAGTSSPSAGTKAIFKVFGMDCPGCHGGLEKNLRKIPGVLDASANWKEQKVTIHFDEGQGLDVAQVQAAIESSNFTPGERLE